MNKLFWGPPLWRQVLIGTIAVILAVGVWVFADQTESEGATTDVIQREDNSNPYQRPGVMRDRFKQGDYDNARGIWLAPEITRLAKRYCNNHPNACPRSSPTRTALRGGACDGAWSWLQWTCKRLETTSCLAVILSNNWLGCDYQPAWVHDVRRVEVICGGDAIVAFLGRAAPVVAGAAVHCFYEGVYKTWLDRYTS